MGLQRVADASSELGALDGRSPLVPFSGVLLFRAHWSCPRTAVGPEKHPPGKKIAEMWGWREI